MSEPQEEPKFASIVEEVCAALGTAAQHADDAAAGVAGLTAGQLYVTDGTGAAPLNVAGILMVKQ